MGFLPQTWLLLALSQGFACSWALSTTPTPGVAEVDLIIPRNESYPPSRMTPMVFAIQNPSLLSSLDPRIHYSLEQQNVNINESISSGGVIELSHLNYTDSDPYFLYWSTNALDFEGTFLFAWELHMSNCSYNLENDAVEFGYAASRSQVFFSTKNGTSPPDLVAATEDGTCDQSLAKAVHIPDLLEVPPTKTWGGPSCAVNPDTLPIPSPCEVKIDSSAAASISAGVTASACANPLHTGISCPSPSLGNAASRAQSPVSGAWILAIATLLAYSLA